MSKDTKLYVISGGPGTGKTTTLAELKVRGYDVLPECARRLAQTDKRFIGRSIKEINPKEFQGAIFKCQKEEIENLEDGIVFCDRGLGDTLAYYKVHKIKASKEDWEYAKKFRYARVFVLDFLNFYAKDPLRQESKEEQEEIQKIIIKTYEELGYKVTIVPFMKLEKRVDFILSKIKNG